MALARHPRDELEAYCSACVQPGTTVYMETEVDAPGQWAFHCHLSYHAAAGMFRKVIVEGAPEPSQAAKGILPNAGGDA